VELDVDQDDAFDYSEGLSKKYKMKGITQIESKELNTAQIKGTQTFDRLDQAQDCASL
jgi:hypothetical protein